MRTFLFKMWNWTKDVAIKTRNVLAVLAIPAIITVALQSWNVKISNDRLHLSQEERDASAQTDLYATFSAPPAGEWPTLRISNRGARAADSIWISQTFFLVDSTRAVFECDLPAFSYVTFAKSRRSMFALEPNADTAIAFANPCFNHFKRLLLERYDGQLFVQWQIEYCQRGKARRDNLTQLYYLYQNSYTAPYPPAQLAGGIGMADCIDSYKRLGPPAYLSYDRHFQNYQLNPPNTYWTDSSGNLHYYYPGSELPDSIDVWVQFPMDRFGFSGGTYVAFVWDCAGDSLDGKSACIARMPVYELGE